MCHQTHRINQIYQIHHHIYHEYLMIMKVFRKQSFFSKQRFYIHRILEIQYSKGILTGMSNNDLKH